jgi:hypothetical protein
LAGDYASDQHALDAAGVGALDVLRHPVLAENPVGHLDTM